MKASLLLLAAAGALSLTACTTLENRRDMYNPQPVNGPYTRMSKEGIPIVTTRVVTTTTTSASASSATTAGGGK